MLPASTASPPIWLVGTRSSATTAGDTRAVRLTIQRKSSTSQHSDDAHHLLALLSTEPAYVFGSSGGALIGLDLATRYPEQIRTLVSHEPPVGGLLPDAERPRLPLRDPQQFAESLGVRYDNREPDAEMPHESPEAKTRLAANRAFLLAHEAPMYPRYTLDIAALAAAPTRIVIAAGQASRGYFPYRIATRLSERLETAVVEFPSHHAGYVSHPRILAQRMVNTSWHLDLAAHPACPDK